MNPRSVCLGVALLIALMGCQKRSEPAAPSQPPPPKPLTVTVVKDTERSRHFAKVNEQLELGGTLYGYVDVDGDVTKLTSGLHDLLVQASKTQPALEQFASKDLTALATTLGLTDVKAIGLSSVPDGTGFFRNRVFFYTPGDRHGLLLGLGGKPGPFTHLNLAPADAAFYSEADLDLPVMYQTIKDVVAQAAGEPVGTQLENALKEAGSKAAFSVLDLIHGLKGHTAMVLRVEQERTIRLPGPSPIVVPAFSLLVCVDGVGSAVEPALAKSPLFRRSEEGALHVYQLAQPLPVQEIQPVLIVDGSTLFFGTSRAFIDECRSLKTGLAQTDEFRKATAGLGAEGNGIGYVHPRLFDQLRRIETLNPSIPPQVKGVVSLVMAKLPKIDRPLVTVRTNLPDGILVRSYWNRSLKQEVAMVAVYNPMTLGMVAAMAIPAFQKVRTASQEKAILNNLRQLSAAADQYYLEKGVTTVTYEQLVGPEPEKYIRRMMPVMGESYRQLRFVQGEPLRLRLPNGKFIEYPQEDAAPRRRAR